MKTHNWVNNGNRALELQLLIKGCLVGTSVLRAGYLCSTSPLLIGVLPAVGGPSAYGQLPSGTYASRPGLESRTHVRRAHFMITTPWHPLRPQTRLRDRPKTMTSTARKAPWILARSAQAAIVAAAVADAFRATAARDHYLHPGDEHRSGFISVIFFYLMTLAIVLFLVWLARARGNAQELPPHASMPSRGWTIGAWFIPVVNFYAPRQCVLGIGRASSTSWEQKRGTALVNLWWAAWITHVVVGVVGGAAAPGSVAFLVVGEVLMIAAAVLLGLVIQRIMALQSAARGATLPVTPLAQA